MAKGIEDGTIHIIEEKKLNNIPSKGRNQWEFLKQYDGKSILSFIEAAKADTKIKPVETYQTGNWWKREIDYCLEHGFLEIKGGLFQEKKETTKNNKQGAELVESGLYIVTLNNIEPISANAQDPRHAGTSVKVNKNNCKFGKAVNLEGRRNNYIKTFGKGNVNYKPVLLTKEIDKAEKLILSELKPYRIKGPKGKITEWMAGVEPDEILKVVIACLNKHDVEYQLI